MDVVINDSGNYMKLDELWAFMSVDDDGNEGLCAFMGPDNVMIPMIAGDPERVDQLKPLAADMALKAGKKIRLARFSTKEIVEEFDGSC